MAPPPIPAPLDPVDAALLHAGPGDVVRAVAVTMAERGLIDIRSSGLRRRGDASVSRENAIENAIFDALTERRSFPELSRAIAPAVVAALRPYEERLRAEKLLRPAGEPGRIRFAAILGALVVLVVGVTLSPVPGLLLGIIASIVAVKYSADIPKTTARGRRYLAALTTAFPRDGLRRHVGDAASVPTPANGALPAVGLLVGLYGASELMDTPYASAAVGLRSARSRSSDSGSGSCGWTGDSGCGGSSGGGAGGHGGTGGHGSHGHGGHGGCGSGGCGGGGCGGGCGG